MQKRTGIFIAAFVGLVGMAVGYVLFQSPATEVRQVAQQSEQQVAAPQVENTTTTDKVESQLPPARYEAYSAAAFASDTGARVLFFHADWCPKCRALDADIVANLSSLRGVTIYKLNYDTELEARKKYGVTLQTTLVRVDSAGDKAAIYVAYDEPTLAAVRQGLSL